ncbi:phosphate acetyltransferase [Buchnera aphidicola (Mollitrichosiphum nigrofasciatum)]|uniref:phosphate acetyltransferase n=1 Tax=Buchnera aphidicola TaxID=9 RepID=UPI0031B7FC5B
MSNKSVFLKPKDFITNIYKLSKSNYNKILLPEGYSIRVIKAASKCQKLNLAQCILLGNKKKIYKIVQKNNIFLHKDIIIINSKCIFRKYIYKLIQLRLYNDMNKCYVYQDIRQYMVLPALMLYNNDVDGIVSGSIHTTAETLRPVFQLIGKDNKFSLISSVFFMLLDEKVLVYADCAINRNPNAKQLADISVQSAITAKLLGINPKIAMVSYATGNSSTGKTIDKVRIAVKIVKKKYPNLIIEGPLQYDAAVIPSICKLKSPFSIIKGQATIIIFPDLNSGNITYKAVQCSAAKYNSIYAFGPILQGIKKPVNDLSRGALVEDIVYTIAITSIQCKKKIN